MTERFHDQAAFHGNPEDYWIERDQYKRERLEDKVRYLSFCIQQKIKDLEKTKELHRQAVRELLGVIGMELAEERGITESQWLGNE